MNNMIDIELYSIRDNQVQSQGGLNWGFSYGNVSNADAYIALTTSFFRNNPGFFPNHGSTINVTWDDFTTMRLLLEGTQVIDGQIYPKNLSSINDKSILGTYIRERMGIALNHQITMQDLNTYGRNTVSIEKIGAYEFNFDMQV